MHIRNLSHFRFGLTHSVDAFLHKRRETNFSVSIMEVVGICLEGLKRTIKQHSHDIIGSRRIHHRTSSRARHIQSTLFTRYFFRIPFNITDRSGLTQPPIQWLPGLLDVKDVKLTTHLHLVPILRKRGVTLPLLQIMW
jgi:hypothetical protein